MVNPCDYSIVGIRPSVCAPRCYIDAVSGEAYNSYLMSDERKPPIEQGMCSLDL